MPVYRRLDPADTNLHPRLSRIGEDQVLSGTGRTPPLSLRVQAPERPPDLCHTVRFSMEAVSSTDKRGWITTRAATVQAVRASISTPVRSTMAATARICTPSPPTSTSTSMASIRMA
jgi:hypothetical protein